MWGLEIVPSYGYASITACKNRVKNIGDHMARTACGK